MNKFDGNLAAKVLEKTGNPLREMDNLFLKIIKDLFDESIAHAASATEQVLNVSANFLAEPTTDLLRRFQSLYFGSGAVEEKKNEINRNVDDLFEQASAQVAQGKSQIKIVEQQDNEVERLELSALQKRLEALISMDSNIRKHIIPSIASMQFEDAVRQRLEHIWQLWVTTIIAFGEGNCDLEKLKDNITDIPTSVAEAKDFFEIVLHRPAPDEGAMPEQMILF